MSGPEELEVTRRYYSKIMHVYRRKGVSIPFFRPATRLGLRLKIAKDLLFVRRFSKGKEERIQGWFDQTRVFFGFALYRSGTAFLAFFLDRVVPNAVIEHEANVDDYWYYHRALQSEAEAEKYIRSFRLAEIYYRMHDRSVALYGEINPYLRRHGRALRQVLPKAKFFHLVRDGREVVRSIMSREILDRTDPLGHLTQPPPGDPYVSQWSSMSRFEKICWLWQSDNRYLRENVGHTLQFERLIRDYDYFKGKLTDYLGMEVPREVWEANVRKIGNPTQVFRMGHWSGWSDSEKEAFRTLCGEEMGACGYEL